MKIKNDLEMIIIDTDPGHDDAMAILMLAKSGLFNILGLTTVAGNSTIQNTTNNARYVLDLIGGQIPIFSGAGKPLRRKLIQAVVHGKNGLAGGEVACRQKLTRNAADKIISFVRANPGRVSILLLGPETNLAEAFLLDPGLPKVIKQVIIMGGAINVPGNKNRVAEFNVFVDPEAAEIVFNAPVKKILIPLDVCNAYLNLCEFEKIKNVSLQKSIKNMMRKYIQGTSEQEKTKEAAMYDPLAAYYLINPAAYELKSMDIRVETVGSLTRGMTVAERRLWGKENNNVSVAIKINYKSFVADFFKMLNH